MLRRFKNSSVLELNTLCPPSATNADCRISIVFGFLEVSLKQISTQPFGLYSKLVAVQATFAVISSATSALILP